MKISEPLKYSFGLLETLAQYSPDNELLFDIDISTYVASSESGREQDFAGQRQMQLVFAQYLPCPRGSPGYTRISVRVTPMSLSNAGERTCVFHANARALSAQLRAARHPQYAEIVEKLRSPRSDQTLTFVVEDIPETSAQVIAEHMSYLRDSDPVVNCDNDVARFDLNDAFLKDIVLLFTNSIGKVLTGAMEGVSHAGYDLEVKVPLSEAICAQYGIKSSEFICNVRSTFFIICTPRLSDFTFAGHEIHPHGYNDTYSAPQQATILEILKKCVSQQTYKPDIRKG